MVVVGGGATEDGRSGETFALCGDAVSSNAVSGMLLAGDFEITTGGVIGMPPDWAAPACDGGSP